MRVALVVHRFPERSEGFLVDHALGLLAAGVDVHVVADEVDASAVTAQAPALADRVHRSPAGRRRRPSVALHVLLGTLRAPVATVRYLARSRGLGRGGAARLARDLPLVRLRPDVVHTEFLTLARARTHLPAVLGCPLTSSVRGYDVAYAFLDEPGAYDAVWPALTALHVLGEGLWHRALERGCPPALDHTVITPAVDAESVPAADPGGPGPLRLVSVGRLHWKKAHHHVLAALAHLRADGIEATLCIVGDGPELEALAFARHQLGLDEVVTFVRDRDRAGAWAELATAQVFVHGAVSEGFGNAVLEAQAAGLPVVTTDAEGLAENIESEVTGLLVPRRDPIAMAAALAELAAEPARRIALGEAGRQRARRRFRPEDQHAAFAAFFARVVA